MSFGGEASDQGKNGCVHRWLSSSRGRALTTRAMHDGCLLRVARCSHLLPLTRCRELRVSFVTGHFLQSFGFCALVELAREARSLSLNMEVPITLKRSGPAVGCQGKCRYLSRDNVPPKLRVVRTGKAGPDRDTWFENRGHHTQER